MPSADSQLEGWAGCLQVCHFLLPRGLELSMNKASALPRVPPTFLSMASLDCLMAPFDLIMPLEALVPPPPRKHFSFLSAALLLSFSACVLVSTQDWLV